LKRSAAGLSYVPSFTLALALAAPGAALGQEGQAASITYGEAPHGEAPQGQASHGEAAHEIGHAGGHGEHHAVFDAGDFGLQLLNLGILLVIIIKFGGGAANRAMKARHDELKAELASASAAKTDAEARLRAHE